MEFYLATIGLRQLLYVPFFICFLVRVYVYVCVCVGMRMFCHIKILSVFSFFVILQSLPAAASRIETLDW